MGGKLKNLKINIKNLKVSKKEKKRENMRIMGK